MLFTTALVSLLSLTSAWTLSVALGPHASVPSYNPATLPSSTTATLTARGQHLTRPLTQRNSFDFASLAPGSYLLTINSRDYAFAPARVDVNGSFEDAAGARLAKVDVWQTFWGNEWGNKGEYRGGGAAAADGDEVRVEIAPAHRKEYYVARQGFSLLSFFKNPMILMGIFSLVMIVGMPMLMDSMDEETKAEFEEMQQKQGSSLSAAQNIQNFDLAGWIAGKSTGESGEKKS